MNDLISIIVPVYNAEKYLSRCIESILNQTYNKLQIILINDGSTDNSLSICKFYQSKDNRIVVVDKKNEGVSQSRNIGIELSKGKYIGFVDSDDYINTHMYEKLLEKIKLDQTQACAMVNHTINKFKIEKGKELLTGKEALKKMLLLEFPTSLWSYLYSSDTIRERRLNEEIHFFEDFDFNFKVVSTLNKISLCYEDFYKYEINESSINSQAINSKKITCLKILEDSTNKEIIQKNNLSTYFIYLKTHFLVSLILNISKLKSTDEKYYCITKKYARHILVAAIKSNQISKTFKSMVLACSISSLFLCKSIYILKYKTNLSFRSL